jgi:glutamate-ammonia-ligase adenylyltransferase
VFVYDGSSASDFDEAERLATRLVRAIGETTSEGATFRVDVRLRPEGNQGPLARSLDGYRAYYERYGQTWEFQALTRARPAAGSDDVARRFMELITPFVYREPMPDDWRREIRRTKARIERERIPPGEDPRFHLKLGRGSLSDIEFTVQLEQLAAGARNPELRTASTLGALDALVGSGQLDADDADRLRDAYELCERARNARYLLTGTPGDALPVAGDEAEKLARLLGYTEQPQQRLRDDYRRVTRRARAVVENVFYGREQTR